MNKSHSPQQLQEPSRRAEGSTAGLMRCRRTAVLLWLVLKQERGGPAGGGLWKAEEVDGSRLSQGFQALT